MSIRETSNGRGLARTIAAILVAALVPLATPPLSGDEQPSPSDLAGRLRPDAELCDVFFVDAKTGWAVGDRGAIWHTTDGGENWALQNAGVSCRLRSVLFLDRSTGWAAGGFTEPYTHMPRGVLLRTFDGGKTWAAVSRARLPSVLQIKFFDEKTGWAVTQNCGMFPHGLLTTDDGGRTWSPVSADGTRTWLSGDFVDPHTGAVVGLGGVAARVDGRAVHRSKAVTFGMQALNRVALGDNDFGFAAGEGGLLMATANGGQSWEDISAALGKAATAIDFSAVSVVGPHVWIAGSPGTIVFHSPDHGRHWEAQFTSQPLPIRALKFVDPRHGWAVGALGMILATADGGQTWQPQRGSRRRAAWLGVFAGAKDVPLEMVAQLSAGDGYVGAVELVGRNDFDPLPAAAAYRNERETDAINDAGADGVRQAWQFPVRSAELAIPAAAVAQLWSTVNRTDGAAVLDDEIAKQIRIWRPEVVITMPGDHGEPPLARIVHEATLRAVDKAGADFVEGDQFRWPGLYPWKVKRVFASLPLNVDGPVTIAARRVMPALQKSLGDFVARPRGMLDDQFETPPEMQSFKLVADLSGQPSSRRDFFGGLAIEPGGDARREAVSTAADDAAEARRAADQRRVVQAIAATAAENGRSAATTMAQINRFASELKPAAAGELLFQLGSLFQQAGHWSLAAETYTTLVNQFPNHELCPAAMVWLIHFYASSELQHATAAGLQSPVRQVRAEGRDFPANPVVRPEGTVNITSAQTKHDDAALYWANKLQQTHAMLYAEPTVRFPLAAVYRRRGGDRDAERIYRDVQSSRDRDAWWHCAAGELGRIGGERATSNAGDSRKAILVCRRADEKPRLDGKLNEAIWRQKTEDKSVEGKSAAAVLRNAYLDDAGCPAAAQLAYDDEFLYVAAICLKAPGFEYVKTDKPRERDADLTQRDRIELLVDVDRDWTTYFQLSIDHRGWTAETCCGAATWNPKWYVAASESGESWTCEVAIPLAELTTTAPQSQAAWVIGIQRIVPGVGFQSWTQPAGPDIFGEGFGYLDFE